MAGPSTSLVQAIALVSLGLQAVWFAVPRTASPSPAPEALDQPVAVSEGFLSGWLHTIKLCVCCIAFGLGLGIWGLHRLGLFRQPSVNSQVSVSVTQGLPISSSHGYGSTSAPTRKHIVRRGAGRLEKGHSRPALPGLVRGE